MSVITVNDSAGVRMTILVDNQAGEELTAEIGFALWLETEGLHVLFDTGQSALESNARALGINLAQTDILVLSHGHYDHTGGISQVLRQAPQADVYCHPGVTKPRYGVTDGASRPIQMQPESTAALDELPRHRLHCLEQPLSLHKRIGLSGPIPRETSYEDTGGAFYLDPEGIHSDLIEDDLALWTQTHDGLIVCVGCAHAGIVNTINHIQRLADGRRIHAVIGGFHLLNASRQRLDETIQGLRLLDPDMLIPCHCTGDFAVAQLREALGERVVLGAAGKTFQF